MLTARRATGGNPAAVLAVPVAASAAGETRGAPAAGQPRAAADQSGALLLPARPLPAGLTQECEALLAQTEHSGRAGVVQHLPRPLGRPRRVLLVGVGAGTEADWRAAGAALVRSAGREQSLTVALAEPDEAAVRGFAEGILLATYRYRLTSEPAPPGLRRVTLSVADPDRYAEVLATATAVAEATAFARDLTNEPGLRKSPAWFVRQVAKAARAYPSLRLRVWDETELATGGFGGLTAVGAGSARPPRLLELAWRPRGAARHVVLVGKGVTFDTGGISIKPSASMTLMRKDMGGAAAVAAATLGAARMRLPVRVTAVLPLAENMPSGSAMRPGDVVRHWGGRTSEVRNTDAEGRLVLADGLAYAAARLRPDVLIDLATLTGANAVALGKRTAAMYSPDDELAAGLSAAAEAAGERVWRMPLIEEYADQLGSDIADTNNTPGAGVAGSVMAALYLREFTGAARDRWAHFDMSAPAWSDRDDAELSRGATGWGVRTLLRYLTSPPNPRRS